MSTRAWLRYESKALVWVAGPSVGQPSLEASGQGQEKASGSLLSLVPDSGGQGVGGATHLHHPVISESGLAFLPPWAPAGAFAG